MRQRYVAAFVLVFLAGLASYASSALIGLWFPDRPTPRDLLFEALPFVEQAQYVTDIALYAGFGLLIFYVWRYARDSGPDILAVFALMYGLRAVIMLLTPLAGASGTQYFGYIRIVQNGAFPSGHAAASTLCWLLVDGDIAPGIRRAMLALAVTEWVAMLVSHGHYSIDIIGGILLAYFVYREYESGSLFGPVQRIVGSP